MSCVDCQAWGAARIVNIGPVGGILSLLRAWDHGPRCVVAGLTPALRRALEDRPSKTIIRAGCRRPGVSTG